jgi:hypothetical protein
MAKKILTILFFSVVCSSGALAGTSASLPRDANGNYGIGTTVPLATLDLVGAGTTTATASLIIRDSAKAAKVTVLDNGNVGIGTTNPASQIEVAGNITRTCTGGDANARWTAGDNHCYMRFNTTKTYDNARIDCEKRGGYLAVITDSNETTFVWNNVGATNAWIGITDIITEATYQAITGEDRSYINWDGGEPNGATSENCVQFSATTTTGKWNDENCSSSHGYICERDF